jgi:hypothetical protein
MSEHGLSPNDLERSPIRRLSVTGDVTTGWHSSMQTTPHRRIPARDEAVASAESKRGPLHGMEPEESYAMRWVLWLSQVPYGVWRERIATPSMREFRHSAERLEAELVRPALARFELEPRPSWTPRDVASAMVSLREGLWLNRCLSEKHSTRPGVDPAEAARTALTMLWQGATQPVVSVID